MKKGHHLGRRAALSPRSPPPARPTETGTDDPREEEEDGDFM